VCLPDGHFVRIPHGAVLRRRPSGRSTTEIGLVGCQGGQSTSTHLDVEFGDLEGTSSLAQTRIVPSVCPDKSILGLSHSRPAGAATHVTPSILTEPKNS